MKYFKFSDLSYGTCFESTSGSSEYFLVLRSEPGESLNDVLSALNGRYSEALGQCGLLDHTAVFSKIFVNDLINQKNAIKESALYSRLLQGAVSVIEQKPLVSAPVTLLSYHLKKADGTGFQKSNSILQGSFQNASRAQGIHYRMLHTANFADESATDSYSQTTRILQNLFESIHDAEMDVLSNTIRTWIYIRDVDTQYKGMVDSRREFFARHGLTNETRYLASTGIEGRGESVRHKVIMDSLSIAPLKPGQIVRMHASENMSETISYNVTFERGLRVRFGDRSHLYISGTASIDAQSNVVFIGDVAKQTRRAIANVEALLSHQGAALNDLAYLFVYLRNFTDWPKVEPVLKTAIPPQLPIIALEAKVCRPAWLIEVEGVAIVPDATEFPAFS